MQSQSCNASAEYRSESFVRMRSATCIFNASRKGDKIGQALGLLDPALGET